MDSSLRLRAVVVGHLTLIVPAAVAIVLIVLGLPVAGPFRLVYCVLAAIAVAWQWYAVALPRWKTWLAAKGAQSEEVEQLARRAGLVWPGEAVIGPFALHTTAAAVCGIHLGPWLLSRWFVWILPLVGISNRTPTGDDYLQHFEVASIVPALVLGYVLSRYFGKLSTFAWIVPTIILLYELITFSEPYGSVLGSHSFSRLSYFFEIQRHMPRFIPGFDGIDPIRLATQLFVVAPFYAGLAYSAGAIAGVHDLLKRIFGTLPVQPETEMTSKESGGQDPIVDLD